MLTILFLSDISLFLDDESIFVDCLILFNLTLVVKKDLSLVIKVILVTKKLNKVSAIPLYKHTSLLFMYNTRFLYPTITPFIWNSCCSTGSLI